MSIFMHNDWPRRISCTEEIRKSNGNEEMGRQSADKRQPGGGGPVVSGARLPRRACKPAHHHQASLPAAPTHCLPGGSDAGPRRRGGHPLPLPSPHPTPAPPGPPSWQLYARPRPHVVHAGNAGRRTQRPGGAILAAGRRRVAAILETGGFSRYRLTEPPPPGTIGAPGHPVVYALEEQR